MSVHEKMTAIANAIREKTGGTDALTLDQMATEIAGIETGGGGDNSVLLTILDRSITEFSDNNLTQIGKYAFAECTALTKIDTPNVTFIGEWAFQNCPITEFDFSNVTTLGGYVFRYGKLTSAVLPKIEWLGYNAFYDCTTLALVDLPIAVQLNNQCFRNTSLTTLILRKNSVVYLTAPGVFTYTPFASGGAGGTVYVPADLIESYQTATNWSTLYAAGTCNFVAIEGSVYE